MTGLARSMLTTNSTRLKTTAINYIVRDHIPSQQTMAPPWANLLATLRLKITISTTNSTMTRSKNSPSNTNKNSKWITSSIRMTSKKNKNSKIPCKKPRSGIARPVKKGVRYYKITEAILEAFRRRPASKVTKMASKKSITARPTSPSFSTTTKSSKALAPSTMSEMTQYTR